MKTSLLAWIPPLCLCASTWGQEVDDAVDVKSNDNVSAPQVRLSFSSGLATTSIYVERSRLRFDRAGATGFFNLSGAASSTIAGDLWYTGGVFRYGAGGSTKELVNLDATQTLTNKTWNGVAIGTQYGGTGQNWSATAAGNVPFFTAAGTMGLSGTPASAGYFLRSSSSSAMGWSTIQAGDIPSGSANYIQNQSGSAQSSSGFWISGTGRANGDFRAPIFYDSDDTSYYVNPASTSQLISAVGNRLEARNNGSGNVYFTTELGGLPGFALNYYPVLKTDSSVFYLSANGAYSGYFQDAGLTVRKLADFDNNSYYVDPAGATSAYFAGSTYSTIFYDFNNSSYYVDPAGATSAYFAGSTTSTIFYDFNNSSYYVDPAGATSAYLAGSTYSTIFYDINNTSYYVDPAGGASAVLAGTITAGSYAYMAASAGTNDGIYFSGTAGTSSRVGAFDAANTGRVLLLSQSGGVQEGVYLGRYDGTSYTNTPSIWLYATNVYGNSSTISSMTWNGSAIGAAYGGTGLNTSGSSGVPTISSGTWSINSALPVSRGGTGTTTTFTQGSVVFAGASGVYTQDNAAFFWDDTSNRLGLGIATPSNTLHLHSASSWTDIQFTSNTTGTGDYQGVKIGTNTAAGDAFFWVYEVQPLSLGTSGTERLVVEADGDIAIKAGALTMNGNTAIDAGAGWHRSYGSTGWYNSTYAGGWHMSDATWIRSYNSKNVYCDVVIRADGGFQVDGNTVIDGDAGWHRTYGATGWYNGTYGGGWYMTDSTWVRVYNDKPVEIGGSTYSASLRYDGIIDPASTSDGNQIYGMPSGSTTGSGWGYVGDSDTYWYYMYSQNFIDPSRREYKKDITSLNDGINRHVMADLDRLNPVLYRYKGESRDMVPGHERRYRPNLHLGLLLEDVPDYLQDQAFSGVDLYALGVMGIVGAKENRKEIRSLRRTLASFQDVGTGVAAGETWVPFSAEFASYLEGRAPVVTITPTSANRGYYVRETTVRGFRVVAEAPFAFNWLATARPTVACEEAPDVPEAVRQELQVPPDRKLQATKYWAADSAGKRQEYEAYLRHLEETDPAKHARVVGENRRNEAFLAEQSR